MSHCCRPSRGQLTAPPPRQGALHHTLYGAKLDCAGWLLNTFPGVVSIDDADAHGQTALHHAARFGREAVAKWCIAHGAGVDRVDATGSTALMYAAEAGKGGICRHLISVGASQHVQSATGTALQRALSNGRQGAAAVLDGGLGAAGALQMTESGKFFRTNEG